MECTMVNLKEENQKILNIIANMVKVDIKPVSMPTLNGKSTLELMLENSTPVYFTELTDSPEKYFTKYQGVNLADEIRNEGSCCPAEPENVLWLK